MVSLTVYKVKDSIINHNKKVELCQKLVRYEKKFSKTVTFNLKLILKLISKIRKYFID